MADPLAPYANAHADPQGEGDARPTALQIIEDERLTGALPNAVMLVTGTSSGIGVDTVRALHETGATIYMSARNMSKAAQVRDDILAASRGTGRLELLEIELSDLASVQRSAAAFRAKETRLDVLVNNAGVRNPPYGRTADGFETQFGANHLGHFLLTALLLPCLRAAATPERAARVVNVTSGSHRRGVIRFDDPHFAEPGAYTPEAGYAQSKTANILHANALERRVSAHGVHALSVSPGGIRGGAQRHDDPARTAQMLADPTVRKWLKSQAQGAATTVWAAVGSALEGKGALYLGNVAVVGKAIDEERLTEGCAPHAFDEEAEERLWRMSEEMVGLQPGWDE